MPGCLTNVATPAAAFFGFGTPFADVAIPTFLQEHRFGGRHLHIFYASFLVRRHLANVIEHGRFMFKEACAILIEQQGGIWVVSGLQDFVR